MKISELIKASLDASDRRELNQAMLFACCAVNGTASKMYPEIKRDGEKFRKFIKDHLDIIELMHGVFNLQETEFPFPDNKGNVGIKFEDIVYEKYRCCFAHGDELPDGYGINFKKTDEIQQSMIDIEGQSIILPESVIYALGLPCVLSPVNSSQKIGSNLYHYNDPINHYVVDRWWGLIDCARKIMDFENQVRLKIDFKNVWPSA